MLMLNEPFLRFVASANGKRVVAHLASVTGISQKTLNKPLSEIRGRTLGRGAEHSAKYVHRKLKEAGYSAEEAEAWMAGHPGATMPGAVCSGVVYEAEVEGIYTYPYTMEFALHIDKVSSRLLDAKVRDDLARFKSVLLDDPLIDARYYQQSSDGSDWVDMPSLLQRLEAASEWSVLAEIFPTIVANVVFSVLACWDVEFCSHYFSKNEPRSVFQFVLPRVEPVIGSIVVGDMPKRRGMLWYPVRRLIDVMACIGEFVRNDEWPDVVPKPMDITREAELSGLEWSNQTLTNWRDGTTAFNSDDFAGLWEALCTNRDGVTQYYPWPLFVATLIFQDLFVQIDARSSKRSILLLEDDYLPWWHLHLEKLKAKGCAFGTSPWPECFNKV
jgi:hypothetical protein